MHKIHSLPILFFHYGSSDSIFVVISQFIRGLLMAEIMKHSKFFRKLQNFELLFKKCSIEWKVYRWVQVQIWDLQNCPSPSSTGSRGCTSDWSYSFWSSCRAPAALTWPTCRKISMKELELLQRWFFFFWGGWSFEGYLITLLKEFIILVGQKMNLLLLFNERGPNFLLFIIIWWYKARGICVWEKKNKQYERLLVLGAQLPR